MITKEYLQSILNYDSKTGIFTWKISKKGIKTRVAGSYDVQGYMQITINYKRYYAHRLAWLYVYGIWPKDQINHKNTIKNDNRIENLEEVTHRQNNQRKKIHVSGKLVGATFDKSRNKWKSQIEINGRCKTLGRYDTELEAHNRYLKELMGKND